MSTNSVRPRPVDILFGETPPPAQPPTSPVSVNPVPTAAPIATSPQPSAPVPSQPIAPMPQLSAPVLSQPAAPIAPMPQPSTPVPSQPVAPVAPPVIPQSAPQHIAPVAPPQFMTAPPPPPEFTRTSRAAQPSALDPLFGLTDALPTRQILPPPPGALAKDQTQYALYVFDMVRNMYEQVSLQLADSPTVSEYCMGVLLKAREAYQSGNYPLAEFYAEAVDAKLKRSARSMKASSGIGIWFLWMWELGMLAFGGFLVGITYVPNLTLFGMFVNPDLLIAMRIVGWGTIGGVISAVYNMPRFVQFREYDPAYAMSYFSRPLQGLLAGAIISLITQTFFATTTRLNPGDVPTGPLVAYIVAAFIGFGQQYVWDFFDSILRAIFRSPPGSGLNPPRPPA